MKNVEDILHQRAPRPNRPLANDFTTQVIQHLNDHPKQTRWSSIKDYFTMKQLTKPAVTAIAAITVVAVSGTAYAAVGGWPTISTMFGGEKDVVNARIVKVDTNNCQKANAFNATDAKDSAFYYRVKDTSKLTNEQVVQIVQGFCEAEQSGQSTAAILPELDKNPLNRGHVVGNYIDSKVTAISENHIALESTISINGQVKTFNQSFDQIDPQVIVTEGGKRIALSDIKIGDHVGISYRANDPHDSANHPGNIDGKGKPVVLIVKNSTDFTSAINYQKYNGKDFEQVTACEDNPSGYCTVEEYFQKHVY